ncbi:MAG: hypothetical protein ACOCW2_02900 [Chitinivibrionales bacterium]
MVRRWISGAVLFLVGFLLVMLSGCSRQTECMKKLSVKNCTELFEKCQQSQTDVQKQMECSQCYDKSCK